MENKILFHGVKDGDTFKIAGMEFIKFPEKDGGVPCVAKNILYNMSFGSSNNFAESKILKRLQDEMLPKLEEAVGTENIRTFTTDLTTLDGLKDYGCVESKISLPTLDFYRANVEIFDKYNPKKWWWLATADSTNSHDWNHWVICVAPGGSIYGDDCDYDYGGVRPILSFNSCIFESLENKDG